MKTEETTVEDEISLSSIFPISCSILHKLCRELMGISVWDSGDRKLRKSKTESQPQRGRRKGSPRWSGTNPSTSCGAECHDKGLCTHEVCISGKTALERRLPREILPDVCSKNQDSCHMLSADMYLKVQMNSGLFAGHWNLLPVQAFGSPVQS